MSKTHSFRWGIDILDAGHVPVYLFMLRNYAKADVTRNEFLCILHLAAYHYETESGESRPAQDTIAEEMGYAHRNSVARIIDGLKEKGMLEVEERPGKTSVYNFAPFSRKMYELWKGESEDAHPSVGAHPSVQVPAHPSVQVPAHPSVHEEKERKEKEKQEEEVVAADAADDEPPQRGDIISLYGDNIGSLTTLIGQELNDLMDEYGETYVKEAIEWAVKTNARKLSAVIGCVKKMAGEKTPAEKRKEAAAQDEADASAAAYVAYAEERQAQEAAKSKDEKAFDKFKSELAAATSEILVRSHFDDVTLALSEEKATFTVPYVGTRYWLQHQAIKAVRRALKAATGRELEVEFVEPEGGAVSEAPEAVEHAA